MALITMQEKEILVIVEPLMDNCLEGSNEDDHQKHTRDFTDRMKKIVTPENLKKRLAFIGLVENTENILELQTQLSNGQILVSKNGGIWRWDGFI